MKKRILSLLLALLVVVGLIPSFGAFASGAAVTVTSTAMDDSGRVTLPRGGEVELCASLREDISGSIQWQIEAGTDVWVDIQNGTETQLRVSCAMVDSLLADNAARVRAVVTGGEDSYASDPVTVVVGDEAEYEAEDTLAAPEVLPAPELEVTGVRADEGVAAMSLDEDEDEDGEDDGTDSLSNDDVTIYEVTIQYLYSNASQFAGGPVARSYVVQVEEGKTIVTNSGGTTSSAEVANPVCVGYEATDVTITIDNEDVTSQYPSVYDANDDGKFDDINLTELGEINSDVTIVVYYAPAEVYYTVRHFQQNLNDDDYTQVEITQVQGKTESRTSQDAAANSYTGFTALSHYSVLIAANGTTIIDIYYTRNYYLISFDLAGGYGVSAIYARYGAALSVGTPSKAGYTFAGWTLNDVAATIPATVEAENRQYTATWTAAGTTYTVAYWLVNDDGTQTYLKSVTTAADAGSVVSGSDDICGLVEHTHTDECTLICDGTGHTHTTDCLTSDESVFKLRDSFSGTGDSAAIAVADGADASHDANGVYLYFIQGSSEEYYGSCWPKLYINGTYYHVNLGGSQTPNMESAISTYASGDLISKGTSGNVTAYKYKISDSLITCGDTQHIHGANCYSCGKMAHTHSSACAYAERQYLEYVKADENVTVAGDSSTVVNVYYKYKTYTIRFIYAKAAASDGYYNLAYSTSDGNLDNMNWGYTVSTLPELNLIPDEDGNNQLGSGSVEIDGSTYYYISLSAQYNADISALWPSNHVGSIGSYYWGSWAAAAGTGYRATYGDAHANIVGVYPTMSAEMILDDAEQLEDGTYLAQNMAAWWSTGTALHAYHIYFEVIDDVQETDVPYGDKYYRLTDTIQFSCAHNGSTRVDPIVYDGFTCINEDKTTQSNSSNYANTDEDSFCAICHSTGSVVDGECNYCNTFYYDRTRSTLSFQSYGDTIDSKTSIAYGATLSGYVIDQDTMEADHYPDDLPDNAYTFAGWYTTAECYDDSAVDWETATMPAGDLVYYAKWTAKTYTVTIRYNNGAQEDTTQTVAYGSYADAPADPSKEHATFIGWYYKDGDEEVRFDFGTMAITGNITVYAKYLSTLSQAVRIQYVYKNETTGETVYVAPDETLTMVYGQPHTFEAKTGSSLYAAYQSGYFPTTASTSVTIDDSNYREDGSEYVEEIEYVKYDSVPYQVTFYVLEADGTKRPAYTKDSDGNLVFVDSAAYAAMSAEEKAALETNAYVEVHDKNEKSIVIELYMPDDYKESLPAEYLPDAIRKQHVVVPGTSDPDDPAANTIEFVYTYKAPVTDEDGNEKYYALYEVQHYIQNTGSNAATEPWILTEWTQAEALEGETVTASPISTLSGYTYSKEETTKHLDGNKLSDDGLTMTGTVVKNNSLHLSFYYTAIAYPYQVMYLDADTNQPLQKTKTTDEDGKTLTGLYGATVTETADESITVDGRTYKLVGSATQSLTIQMEGGTTAAVNTITFYYQENTASLQISKKVVLDEEQADEVGIDKLPESALTQEFTFTITNTAGFNKTVYTGVVTTLNDDGTETTETRTILTEGATTMVVELKHNQTIVISGLAMGEYTITETYVPGFRITVDGNTYAQQKTGVSITKTLAEANATVEVKFTNSYPFFVGELVLSKELIKLDADDPTTERNYKIAVTLTPADATREVDRTVTWLDATGDHTLSIPALTGTDADETEFELVVWVPAGGEVTLSGVPAGDFTAEEQTSGTIGYITDYYAVTYNKKTHINDETRGTSATVTGVVHGGHATTVTFKNTYKKGSLTITKTVTDEENYNLWTGDTFTFTVTGTTELPDGEYSISVGTESETATVSGGKVTIDDVTITAEKLDTPYSLTIANLPAGYYTVTEKANDNYEQTTAPDYGDSEYGLLVNNNDPEKATEFAFINTLKYFDLTIVTQCADSNSKQSFLFDVVSTTDESIKLTVVLVGNDKQTIKALPAGIYTVTEQDAWSWRETAVDSQTVALGPNKTVTFNFEAVDDDHWLSGYSYKSYQKGGGGA